MDFALSDNNTQFTCTEVSNSLKKFFILQKCIVRFATHSSNISLSEKLNIPMCMWTSIITAHDKVMSFIFHLQHCLYWHRGFKLWSEYSCLANGTILLNKYDWFVLVLFIYFIVFHIILIHAFCLLFYLMLYCTNWRRRYNYKPTWLCMMLRWFGFQFCFRQFISPSYVLCTVYITTFYCTVCLYFCTGAVFTVCTCLCPALH